MTSNKKYQNEPVVGHQPGTNGESSKFQESNRVLSTKTAMLQLFEICIANCWNPPSFILSKEEGTDHQKGQVHLHGYNQGGHNHNHNFGMLQ
ncbi:hypothetical protein OPV22_005105 [Ensete ventricosum]|uniref:Uncharacterized protein n=1 Tax=Ensete ventricosum TaxID=4639 RepID=A0AAV8RK95_ENSVE|nr:hypothetical protein OPV22_005105 [Ensete ventricosum]